MPTQVQLRRGTTAEHSSFTGAAGEVTVDTTKKTVVVHDGSTAGGIALAKETNATLAGSVNFSGGTANGVMYLNGSKVATTGSALTFNGSQLLVGSNTAGYGTLNVARDTTSPYASLTVTDQANAANTIGLYLRQAGSSPTGISTAGAPLAFYLGGPGVSEGMRLDSTNGNLLLGTTANNYVASIISANPITTNFSGTIALRYNVSGQTNAYYKGMTGTSIENAGARGLHIFNYDADASQGIKFYPNSYAGQTANPAVTMNSSGNFLVGQSSWDFANNGTQIAASGRIFNTSSTDYNLELAGAQGGRVRFYTSAGGVATTVGSITVGTSSTAYNTSSDYRLKDNPQPLTGSGAFIDALKPKTWEWKVDGSKGVGFIAHEVQEVSPGSVVGEKDGEQMQAMEYGSAEFIANIIAELQSLRQRVAQLEGA